MKRQTYIAIDLETTGLNPRLDRILEIGAVRVENGEQTASFSTFVDVGIPVPEFITGLTGITDEMARSGLPVERALIEFLDFCGECAILGHNILFDYGFLKQNMGNQGILFERKGIDTFQIARKYLPDLPSKSLENLCAHYGICQEKKHRACEDAWSASRLYQNLAKEFYDQCPEDFAPRQLVYQAKKESPITKSQKLYLLDLVKYHRIELDVSIDSLTKSQASRMIDHIILQYGRIRRR